MITIETLKMQASLLIKEDKLNKNHSVLGNTGPGLNV